MVDVFISYASKNRRYAEKLSSHLESWGIIVYCHEITTANEIQAGNDFTVYLENEISEAKVLVVLWTEDSRSSSFVKEEALLALRQGKLFQVLVDGIEPPFGFSLQQGCKMTLRNGDFEESSLSEFADQIRILSKKKGPQERIIHPRKIGEPWNCKDPAISSGIPGTDIYVSFHPCGDSGLFSLMCIESTPAWVKDSIKGTDVLHKPFENQNESTKIDREERYLRTRNEVFFINDPLRPYSIQIGGLRSQRDSASPGFISCSLSPDQLRYIPSTEPAIIELFAEVLENADVLDQIWENLPNWKNQWTIEQLDKKREWINTEDDPSELRRKLQDEKVIYIRKLISRNPNASKDKQAYKCVFCSKFFQDDINVPLKEDEDDKGVYIIENSFPYGPYFHYVIITKDSVHYWEDMKFNHVLNMNLVMLSFLKRKKEENGGSMGAGIEFGFNSSVKHLVLGHRTRSSAGASIPHIHKQVWGMAPKTANLAEHLIQVSDAWWRQGIDYQGQYLKALGEKGNYDHSYIVWDDEHVALYVPYGQCSLHEMQVMVKKPVAHLLELSEAQMISLSKAEYIALRIYSALKVTSYNTVALSKLFNDHRAPTFRMVVVFVTREVDLAMSELSLLYVVDKHPWDSREEIEKILEEGYDDENGERVEGIRCDVMEKIEDIVTSQNLSGSR